VTFAPAFIGLGPAISVEQVSESAFNRCRAVPDDAIRLRCFENIGSESQKPLHEQVPDVLSASPSVEKWRLVRSRHPQGGKDAVSIIHAGELSSSDPDFAGLILRCGDLDVEILIAVIRPFPLRDRPHVTLASGGSSHSFSATVMPPGALVLLPPEATELARGAWLSIKEISASVEDPPHAIVKGVVGLDGLGTAFRTLVANCPAKAP
jgi:hypothetical protein